MGNPPFKSASHWDLQMHPQGKSEVPPSVPFEARTWSPSCSDTSPLSSCLWPRCRSTPGSRPTPRRCCLPLLTWLPEPQLFSFGCLFRELSQLCYLSCLSSPLRCKMLISKSWSILYGGEEAHSCSLLFYILEISDYQTLRGCFLATAYILVIFPPERHWFNFHWDYILYLCFALLSKWYFLQNSWFHPFCHQHLPILGAISSR